MPEFFDTFVETSGSFVTADEKKVLSEAGVPIPVVGVSLQDGQFGEQYLLQVGLEDPATGDVEDRVMAFSTEKVESRNRMLKAMQDWFAAGNTDPIYVKLEKVGRSWILRKAE